MEENSGTTPPASPPPAPPAAPSTPPPSAGQTGRPGPASDTSKLLAAIGYVIGIVALVALLIEPYKDEKYVKFHAVQAIALWVVGIALNVIWAIPVVGWIVGAVVSVALVVFAIIGLIKAFSGEYWEMPIVYGIVKGWIGE